MANPPQLVKTVGESVCILLGVANPTDWKTFKKLLGNPSPLINMITDYDYDKGSIHFRRQNFWSTFFAYLLLLEMRRRKKIHSFEEKLCAFYSINHLVLMQNRQIKRTI